MARREKKLVQPTFSEQQYVTNVSLWLEYNSTELGAIITIHAVLSRNTNTSQDSNFCQFQYKFFHNLYLEGTNSHNNCEFHTLVFNHQYTHTETMLDV